MVEIENQGTIKFEANGKNEKQKEWSDGNKPLGSSAQKLGRVMKCFYCR